ncbi:MAG: SDR family oxidoreductase [Gammaproteobacteria bacterium]|nr:SDR family oxidoreductase [Gammaproteobacteria bacterium]
MTQNRTLITGASAGLGSEFARQLAAAGHDLVLVARRDDRLKALADELSGAHGVGVDTIKADLSDPATPAALFEEIQRRGLHIDYLVNNAGSSGPDLLSNRSWDDNRQYLELMITSVAGMCHYFIPPMREKGFGRVLNVASVAGLLNLTADYSYGPTKAYLVSMSEGLSTALAGSGVHVTALCPGFTHTEFHASEKLTRMKKSTPGFIWYEAETVVREGLAALEKGRSRYISGRLYRFMIPVLRMPGSRWLIAALGIKL